MEAADIDDLSQSTVREPTKICTIHVRDVTHDVIVCFEINIPSQIIREAVGVRLPLDCTLL